MTDNENRKALESYSWAKLYHESGKLPKLDLGEILKLVEHYEAEIERLKKVDKEIDNFARMLCKKRLMNGNKVTTFKDLQDYIKDREAEAVKKFAERFKQQFESDSKYSGALIFTNVDVLVEETEGEG